MTQPTIAQIKQAVVQHFGMKPTDMNAHRRMRGVARPRQIAMYLSRELTEHSLPTIGRAFNRDHTTCIHGVRVIERLLAENAYFGERDCFIGDAIESIIKALQA